MLESLFRQQSVGARPDSLRGDILLFPKLSHTLMIALIFLWLGVVIFWLTHNTYARKETVQGWLQPSAGVTRVYASSDGLIKRVLVAEGDVVAKDQPLIVINGDQMLASGEQLETLLLNEYKKQQTVLSEQLTRSRSIHKQQFNDLTQRIAAAEQDLVLLRKQLATLSERQVLLSGQVTRYQLLNQDGHVSSRDLETTISQELALQSDEQEIRRQLANQKNRIEQLQIEQLLLPEEQANTAGGLTVRLSDIAQRIAQLHGQQQELLQRQVRGLCTICRPGWVRKLLLRACHCCP